MTKASNEDLKVAIRNKIKGNEQQLEVIALGYSFLKASIKANSYKVNGRVDMQKIYLAKSLYNMADM